MIRETIEDPRPWPLRPLLLLALGALCGLVFHWLTKGDTPWQWTSDPAALGGGAFVAAGGIVFAFSLERLRWSWSVGFAIATGLVIGLVTWRNGAWSGWGGNEGWQFFSALLAVAIAVPLFQTMRDSGRPRVDYRSLHGHSWTNGVLWCAAWAFVLAVFALVQLLSELFNLIGLHLLRDLLAKVWFEWMLVGGALGAAIGLLRDRDRVLGLVQKVVTAILSVLTPILAIGLVVFVLSLPFTGLQPLWEQTRSTTPILLACMLGAFGLINATIGNGPDEEPRAAILRHSAMALAAVMLPLGLVAAVSTGKRIGQYGLTPDRLWAIVFVGVAIGCGALYLAAIARRRLGWAQDVRRANIALAIGVCGVALFLALPILSFGAMSASDQVARLQSGRISPDKFDWVALRFDFGPAGKRAFDRLALHASDPRIRTYAARIAGQKTRFEALMAADRVRNAEKPRVIDVLPLPAAVPKAISDLLFFEGNPGDNSGLCAQPGHCLLKWQPGERQAIALIDPCGKDPREARGEHGFRSSCRVEAELLELTDKGWRKPEGPPSGPTGDALRDPAVSAEREAALAGKIEVRPAQARQIFIDGKPHGDVFR